MEKPGFFLNPPPGQRKAMIEATQDLERRGFPYVFAGQGSAPTIRSSETAEHVVRPYLGASWLDGLTHCLATGMATERITFGTAIEVTYTRHPHEMLGIANYINETCDGRFILGIGPGHTEILEPFRYRLEKPLAHMRQYVYAMREAAAGQPMPPIMFSALRKKMVRLAGELADGVIWANAVRSHLPESLQEIPAAKRDTFLVGNIAPAYVSDDRGEALAAVRLALSNYLSLTNYQRYFIEAGYGEEVERARAAIAVGDHAGIMGAVSEEMADDIAVFGTPAQVREKVEAFQAAGVTHLCLATTFHSENQPQAVLRVAAAFD